MDLWIGTGSLEKENELRAVFLGAKPSLLMTGILSNIDFTRYGLKSAGDFVYNEDCVKQVVDENKKVFGKNSLDIRKLFEEVSQNTAETFPDFHLKVGLLLGFPRSASEWFANTILRGNVSDVVDNVRYNVGGVSWVSGEDAEQENTEHKEILQKAFEIANKL